jgi:NAD(P)-dependent dehydrogenase (short-subunit alcohol dehydrogenase family)
MLLSTSYYPYPLSFSPFFSYLDRGNLNWYERASRGIGKGIALGLAEELNAVIYITGRSMAPASCTDKEFGGSLQETAREIESLGGIAIPCLVDHRNDDEVKALFERIEVEQGKLDILVNNCLQIPMRPDGKEDPDLLFRNFWEQPGWFYDSFMNVGLRSHYIASAIAAPLMQRTASAKDNGRDSNAKVPLIAMISSFGGISYSFNVAYGAGKAAVDRLARDMALELKDHGVGCISFWPGVVRTERMADMLAGPDWEKRYVYRFVECICLYISVIV